MRARLLVAGLAAALFAVSFAGADELQDLGRDFWSWRAVYQPVSDDDIPRIERPEGWVPVWTRASIEKRRRDLAAFEERLGRIDATGMPVAWKVDRRLLRSAFARVRWELDVERGWERNPAFYVTQTLGALLDVLLPPPPFSKARGTRILRQLEAIPATIESARGNLVPAAAPFARLAIAALADVRPRLHKTAAELAPLLPPESAKEIAAAAEKAVASLEGFRDWLGNRAPTLRVQTAVGREGYLYFLRNVALIPETPEELLAMGRQEWARAVARETMEETRDAGLPALPLFADQAAQIARGDEDEALVRQFLERRKILTVPGAVRRYRQRPLPAYLAPLAGIGEMDDFASPSRLSDEAWRYIPVPGPGLGYFDLSAARDPRPGLVHEGVPGHAFQLALSWAHEDPIRRHYYDSGANEGIAFYAEEMLLDAGLFDDRPRARGIIASYMRLRALRVEVDVQLALGRFTIDQAADYLARTVPMDAASAREEAAAFASTPGQAISYQIGKVQILRFLADARRERGEKFSLRDFHDFLWKNGNVPIALLRWEYLGLDDELVRVDRVPVPPPAARPERLPG
ncbi:MAG: DUF885 family protein [Acidobacteriota bacterium]